MLFPPQIMLILQNTFQYKGNLLAEQSFSHSNVGNCYYFNNELYNILGLDSVGPAQELKIILKWSFSSRKFEHLSAIAHSVYLDKLYQ